MCRLLATSQCLDVTEHSWVWHFSWPTNDDQPSTALYCGVRFCFRRRALLHDFQRQVTTQPVRVLNGVNRHSNKHASRHIPKAQYAFKDLMIHWILQFALRIAFRCVLHRCGSLDIRCCKLCLHFKNVEQQNAVQVSKVRCNFYKGLKKITRCPQDKTLSSTNRTVYNSQSRSWIGVVMILPQVHLRKPCYDFTFL